METPGAGKTCFFPFPGWTTEQREGVSYDVPMTAEPPVVFSDSPVIYSSFLALWLLSNGIPACLRTSYWGGMPELLKFSV